MRSVTFFAVILFACVIGCGGPSEVHRSTPGVPEPMPGSGERCVDWTRDIKAHIPGSPIPIPFNQNEVIDIEMLAYDLEYFDGTMTIDSVEGPVPAWIKNLTVNVAGRWLFSWQKGEWVIDRAYDLLGVMEFQGDRLWTVWAIAEARGIRPIGTKFTLRFTLDGRLCGIDPPWIGEGTIGWEWE